MTRETVISFNSDEGMSLQVLKQNIEEALRAGVNPDAEVRVNTFIRATKHGSQIKKLTVIDK